jgi:hypothetical protein
MLTTFDRLGDIPDRPASLCRQIVRLMLQDWDTARQVTRESRYSRFSVDDKMDFLSSVAFELLRDRRISFDERELRQVYEKVAPLHELPSGEASQVVAEIESHTGLVVATSGRYEFSHLTLMEYLAAECMVRTNGALTQYWRRMPEVAAVAVSLAPDGGDWVADLVRTLPSNVDNVGPLVQFVARLAAERPRIMADTDIGKSLLMLVFKTAKQVSPDTAALLATVPGVSESVESFMATMSPQKRGDSTTFTRWSDGGAQTWAISVPTVVLNALRGQRVSES